MSETSRAGLISGWSPPQKTLRRRNSGSPATMYIMSYNTSAFLRGTAAFRKEVSDEKLHRLVRDKRVVEVGRYAQEAAAVVVAPDHFALLRDSQERFEALRAILPLLLAAVRSGAAIPSQTLTQLGIDPGDESWQALNRFQASFPVHFDGAENGGLIARGALTPQPFVGEADLELELLEND
jgi:hypothetical protein